MGRGSWAGKLEWLYAGRTRNLRVYNFFPFVNRSWYNTLVLEVGTSRESPGPGVSGAQAAKSSAKIEKSARGITFFLEVGSNKPIGARKCASEAQQER